MVATVTDELGGALGLHHPHGLVVFDNALAGEEYCGRAGAAHRLGRFDSATLGLGGGIGDCPQPPLNLWIDAQGARRLRRGQVRCRLSSNDARPHRGRAASSSCHCNPGDDECWAQTDRPPISPYDAVPDSPVSLGPRKVSGSRRRWWHPSPQEGCRSVPRCQRQRLETRARPVGSRGLRRRRARSPRG